MSLSTIGALLLPVWGVISKMLLGLLTEAFVKKAVVIGLEKVVAKTASPDDDRLLAEAKKVWNIQ